MRKKYTAEEILNMAVKKAGVDPGADLDGDARVTAADARAALRGEQKDPGDGYVYQPEKTLGGMRETLLTGIADSAAAGFDVNADRLYEQYRRRYEQNARAAAENAWGLAAAGTGGYGSSWASSAAAAAYNGMMEGLNDRAAEIDTLSDKRRQQTYENALKALTAVNDAEQTDYGRWQDRLDLAFAAAKQGDYGLMEELGLNAAALRRGDITALAELAAKYGDDSFLAAMGVDVSGRAEARAREQADADLQRAIAAAKYGDYSALEALGVDTAELRYNALLDTAAKLAEYGDYSALEALGVDVAGLKEKDLLARAETLAKYGDYSLLGTLSGNLAGLRQKVSVTVQKGAEAAYAAGGWAGLVKYLNRQVGYGQLNEAGKRQILTLLTGGSYGA